MTASSAWPTPIMPIQGTGEVLGEFSDYLLVNRFMRAPRYDVSATELKFSSCCCSVCRADPNAQPAVAPAPRLKLTAEQEYIIRELILKNPNVQKENSAPETVGVVVPDDVKLYPLPPEVVQKVPQARSHMFFVKDDEVILVSSSDRRVADLIKKKSTD